MPRKKPEKDEQGEERPAEEPGEGDAQEAAPESAATCPYQSADLTQCCALGGPIAAAAAACDSIRRDSERLGAAIRFQAELATPSLTDELTVKLKASVDYALHQRLSRHVKQTLDVLLLVREQAPAKGEVLPGQRDLFAERPEIPEPVEMLVCATCKRIIRAEGVNPGAICGFCLEGMAQIESVTALECSNCQQPQESAASKVGDTCSLCKEGRYLYTGMESQAVPGGPPDALYITPDHIDEFADATSGLEIQNDRVAKALVQVGEHQYAVTEAVSADPITFLCWRAVPLSEWGDDRPYVEVPPDDGANLHGLRITLRDSGGAPFVLDGPPMRVIAQPAEETEEQDGEPEEDGNAGQDEDPDAGSGEDG